MTIKQRQYCRDVSQQKQIVVSECRKERISEEMSLKFEGKLTEGSNNQLLILANFAELISESEYILPTVHENPQNDEDSSMEAQNLQENADDVMAKSSDKNWGEADEMPPISHDRNERDGSHGEGTVLRLSHIRRQARLKIQSFMKQSIQEDSYRTLQGSKMRLTQIRRQARSGNHIPRLNITAVCSHGKLLGGITRLSQIRREARSKNNCSRQEGTGEPMHVQLDCQFHEVDSDNVDKMMLEKGQLRLSQLRRKVRSGNVDLVALTDVGNTV
ncbi:hypothetical protein F383_02704 [Gossypium arboreum]|uniref:Uncharacterized protein n=2 Tax=Gossypium arboreum TaxID=29729 RepID=A0ABR0MEV5_GOSAR|nr:uncharacterized protein LOC108464170 isoform X2 [Gossypium arboreum]KAK5771095.1 hypothetical protein PVK06_047270 [Gossypium arboreum]KHG25336.1 hypothetical protein F383_02704 [Gossypium arboreum]